MSSIAEQCKEASGYIIETRRRLHQIPELGIHVPKTQDLICAELDKMGIPYKRNTAELNGVVDSGVVALIEGKNTDKVMALRADIDALPVTEKTGFPFASTHENQMHACGHDTHTAMLLGAAKVLNDNKDQLNGSVKLFFQSGEEVITGAKMLLEGGCMDNPKVTACFGMHSWPLDPNKYKPGEAIVIPGCMMASGNRFTIKVRGVGCHGSSPHLGIDPIVAGSYLIAALQEISSREVFAGEPKVLSICQFHAGTFWNVIPDEVWMEGTLRTTSVETRAYYIKRIEEIAKGISSTFRCECVVDWVDGTPPVMNDPEITKIVAGAAKKVLGEELVCEEFSADMANEDFAYFQERVPGTFIFLNITNKEKDNFIPLHSAVFNPDEEVLWHGTAIHVQTALDYLS